MPTTVSYYDLYYRNAGPFHRTKCLNRDRFTACHRLKAGPFHRGNLSKATDLLVWQFLPYYYDYYRFAVFAGTAGRLDASTIRLLLMLSFSVGYTIWIFFSAAMAFFLKSR